MELFSESKDYQKQRERQREEVRQSNDLLKAPASLSDEERAVWEEIANLIISSTHGMPFDVIYKLFNNPTLQKGTVIIYTAITNRLSGLNKECLRMFNLQKIYAKSHNLIAGQAIVLFHGMLYKFGVTEVEFCETKENFTKRYGFFTVV